MKRNERKGKLFRDSRSSKTMYFLEMLELFKKLAMHNYNHTINQTYAHLADTSILMCSFFVIIFIMCNHFKKKKRKKKRHATTDPRFQHFDDFRSEKRFQK